jgi:16S rRNA (guanine527-N7)-methyltransferase
VNRDLLCRSAGALGISLTEWQLNAFELVSSELLRWNKQINLTAITDQDEIVIKHLIDSLSLVSQLDSGVRLLDIGSGAGFPALPVAIVRPDVSITSIDAVEKKIHFQRHICRLLKISTVEALHGRAEEISKKRMNYYDVVTSRAFSRLDAFLKLALPFVREYGKAVAMRGIDGEQTMLALDHEVGKTGFVLEEVVKYELPLKMGRRCLVVASKSPLDGCLQG